MELKEFNRLGTIADNIGKSFTEEYKLSNEGIRKVIELLSVKYDIEEEEYEGQDEQEIET